MAWLRAVVLTLIWTGSAMAQTPFSAAISGKVRDATPAVLAGASVSIAAPTKPTGVSGQCWMARICSGIAGLS